MNPFYIPKIVNKPWGREVWYADQHSYAGKVLEVTAGARLSLQYHKIKTETLYLLSGKIRLVFKTVENDHHQQEITEADYFLWEAGQAVHIPTATIHRFEAIEDSVLLEVSTPHLTDVVRIQDDYSRPKTDEPIV